MRDRVYLKDKGGDTQIERKRKTETHTEIEKKRKTETVKDKE